VRNIWFRGSATVRTTRGGGFRMLSFSNYDLIVNPMGNATAADCIRENGSTTPRSLNCCARRITHTRSTFEMNYQEALNLPDAKCPALCAATPVTRRSPNQQ
jgi:hypothetical protein